MRIAMVAGEANPLCKTGGLADVAYALSKELASDKHEVILVIPFYQTIRSKAAASSITKVGDFPVYMSWRTQKAEIFTAKIDGITYYLIGNDYYFSRPNLYGYDDDGERFAFFTIAARNLFGFIDFTPDIIHVHDWQPGMLPALVKVESKDDPRFAKTKFVLTIHNEAFQGMLGQYFLNNFYNLSDELYYNGSVRFHDQVSTLKSAIVYCDKVSTVSPNHARELLTPEGGYGLDPVLKLREWDFCGIVNGIDTAEFDPRKDKSIAANFSASDFEKGKAICRENLLKSVGIPDSGGPLFGLVSRLTFQKGIHLVLDVMRQKLSEGAMLVILGSGERALEEGFERLRYDFQDRCGIYLGYSDPFAHKVYAGSDFFLMPSLFEPCGIGQMIAEAYGSLPIARSVGGLPDTIIGYNGSNEDEATGFLFPEFNADSFGYTIGCAMDLYKNKPVFTKLVRNAMNMDHSWKSSCKAYEGLYEELLRK